MDGPKLWAALATIDWHLHRVFVCTQLKTVSQEELQPYLHKFNFGLQILCLGGCRSGLCLAATSNLVEVHLRRCAL